MSWSKSVCCLVVTAFFRDFKIDPFSICRTVNWPSDFRGEPNDSEVGARHGREAKEDTVAAGMIFDNLEDNDGWLGDERTPVA